MTISLYHNPKCSKSREALAQLQAAGVEFETNLYLQRNLTAQEVQTLAQKLGVASLAEMMRTKDELFAQLALKQADEQTLLQALCQHSALLQRPIIVNDERAIIARGEWNLAQILTAA